MNGASSGDGYFLELSLSRIDDVAASALITLLHEASHAGSKVPASWTWAVLEALELLGCPYRVLPPGSAAQERMSVEQLAKAKALLTRSEESLAIHSIAKSCGVSAGYFSRAFKAATGMSPRDWRLAQRVQKAKRFLESTNRSMLDISGECGFGEQSHFNHIFLRIVGVTPGAWRKTRRTHASPMTGEGRHTSLKDLEPGVASG